MKNSQRFSDLEGRIKSVGLKLEGFQAPNIQKDLTELEEKVRRTEQKANQLLEANKIAAVEDRRTTSRVDLIETGLEGIKKTLAPLQELLNDNQAALKREEKPSFVTENQKMPSLDNDEGFPGLNLEGASLEDLKKLRKLVSKKIKAASKKKPEINPNQGEATITYEKSHADRGALREPERNPDKDHNHQADGYKSPNFGVRKTNNEEWVTVKRGNWNKFKELAGGVGGLQKPSDKPSAKPSAKNQSNARADQRKQKQSEPTRD